MKRQFLIIGGTFKSGTSSAYTHLNQLDAICGSKLKETGFFVPARYGEPVGSFEDYLQHFDCPNEEKILMEASPGYLYGGRKVANAIQSLLGEETRMIFLLREPVQRFQSFFKMLSSGNATRTPTIVADRGLSFEAYTDECMNYVPYKTIEHEKENYVYNGLRDGAYVEYLQEWFDVFGSENVRVVFFEELENAPKAMMEGILNWANIDPKGIEKADFRAVNQFQEHQSKALQKVALFINRKFEKFWRKNERLKKRLVGIYRKINTKKTAPSAEDQEEVLARINNYYDLPNKKLAALLREKGYTNLPDWLS